MKVLPHSADLSVVASVGHAGHTLKQQAETRCDHSVCGHGWGITVSDGERGVFWGQVFRALAAPQPAFGKMHEKLLMCDLRAFSSKKRFFLRKTLKNLRLTSENSFFGCFWPSTWR